MSTTTKSKYVTQAQAAEMLGVCTRTVRNMIADGRLRAYSLGPRVIRLHIDEVEAALQPLGFAA
jgi:excisionase family DNA binding protein